MSKIRRFYLINYWPISQNNIWVLQGLQILILYWLISQKGIS